ncbi:uncharacterized protein Z520_10367 [Fonsecaea multimorphosa CBS 102226]|uniref:Peroxin 20 n=1 Tax=Fonsecaea multimorphosa CBS 102226 TaxID=1442371 RepID=A0A0D2GWP4_9EURO|nr:uncharacterized protein Z520_10367 [Fonsecaea multimorphosa CBS 102226]KIX94030.1 hypothetical protein Z520_10367 [Fonsecaea multimorphosa CBS 102226]OAL19376.1 hypothetical protein AYO22_09920 [Fonsecaea multimorphosa]
MADALCGPSNPLQNLQKHTQVDRTLQQDRLIGNRQSPSQGFRTVDPRAGSLDADFQAFETSTPHPFQFQQPELFHPQSHVPSAPAGWAADFQRLSISQQQQPMPAGQFRIEAPLIKSTTLGGWQNEFMRQRSGAGTPVAQGKQAVRDGPQLSNASMFQQSMMDYSQPMYQSYSGDFQQQPQMQQQATMMSMEQHVQISDVDFEAAFADAFAHAQEMDQQRAASRLSSDPDAMIAETDIQRPVDAETVRIGSDAIAYREKADRTADQDTRDADELARTAGQLLTSVSHDNSEKFQNSQFLQLMRKIRDREVEVQGDELQETGRSTSTPAQESRHFPSQEASNQQSSSSSHFEFPDMDAVYAPTNTSDDAWGADSELDQNQNQNAQHRFAGSWDYPPASAPQWKAAPEVTAHDPQVLQRSPYTTYGFDDDQYPTHPQPQSQFEALHPGGKYYPDQSPRLQRAAMDNTTNVDVPGEIEINSDIPVPVVGATQQDGAPLEKRISASDFDSRYLDSTWFNFHR